MPAAKASPVQIDGPFYGQAAVCEPILRALPPWFGIESALQYYVQTIETLPTLLARVSGASAGFLTLKQHNAYSAELYVLGVYPQYRRQGVGRALVQRSEEILRQRGVEYLQVKTLSAAHPDPHYVETRAFYLAQGFRPLEELPELWGEHNPCLLMIKALATPQAEKVTQP
jgi:ribosomal protein S18 acetylase RimI-like enzyme